MPSPWPEAPVPPPAAERPALLSLPAPVEVPRVRVLTRSRLALAASVALMLGGAWILSGSSTPYPEGPIVEFGIKRPSAQGNRPTKPTGAEEVVPVIPSEAQIETREEILITPEGARIKVIVGPSDSFPK
jgi:hypothetical protein